MKKKYLLWLLYTLLPLYILLFQCGLKTYAGTDPRYEGTGYLLTSGDMLQILNDITKTDDVTYTDEEIVNMTTNYNQWAESYHQQNPTFCTNNVLFYYGLKYENTINVGTKDICFLISRNPNLNVNYTYIYLNAASWNLESGYIQLLGLGELVGSPGNYTDNGILTPLIYVFGPNKTVWSNENFRVGQAQCKYKSLTVDSDGTNKYVNINTMTTTLYSVTSNVDKYEVFLRYPNSTRDFYFLTNHTLLNGSGEEIIPTPTATPTPTPTPTPSGDNESGDNSGDIPGITPTPIDYTGQLNNINDTINSGDTGIIASIGNLGGTIINGIENVLKSIFNWAMGLLFEPNIELIQEYIDGLQDSIGGENNLLTLNTYIFTKELELIKNGNSGDFKFEWNDIEIPIFNENYTIIKSGEFNLTQFVNQNQKLKNIYDKYIIIVTGISIFIFAGFLRNILFKVLGLNWIGNLAEEDGNVQVSEDDENIMDERTGEVYTTHRYKVQAVNRQARQSKTYRRIGKG